MIQNRHGIDKIIIRSHDDDDAVEEEGKTFIKYIVSIICKKKKICEIL